jgi:hypothetical protein
MSWDAMNGRTVRRGSQGGVHSPSNESTTGCVRGQEGEEEREGREVVPAHVAQTGTLTAQGGNLSGVACSRCTDGPFLDRKRGIAERGDHPRCTDGHTPAGVSEGREG